MTPSADYVRDLLAWARRGEGDDEKRARFDKVRGQLFPEGLSAEETDLREALIASLAKDEEEARAQRDPMPAQKAEAPSLPPVEWDGFVKKKSHLGSPDRTCDELRRMQEEASGSPFFPTARPKPAPVIKKPTS